MKKKPTVAASILAGMEDALAYAKGDRARGVAHLVRVPEEVDVRALRKRFKLSQAQFAAKFGPLQQWEQKRRNPDRATRVLLTVIDKEPKAVERALAKA